MRSGRGSQLSERALAAYVDGEVTPSEAEAIEAELADSASVQRRVAGLRRVRDALSRPVPELEGIDLASSIREQLERPAPAPRLAARVWGYTAGACIAAAATIAVVQHAWDVPPSDAAEAEFRAKAAQPERAEQARWAGIRAYYVAGDAPPEPLLGRQLPSAAGLLFSYTNLGPTPFAFLMIFVTDARGELRWCYPAYAQEGTDPASLPIQRGEVEVPLGELIRLDLPPGPATLHALFSRHPLHVLEVEGWLRERTLGVTPPWPDVAHRTLALEVAP